MVLLAHIFGEKLNQQNSWQSEEDLVWVWQRLSINVRDFCCCLIFTIQNLDDFISTFKARKHQPVREASQSSWHGNQGSASVCRAMKPAHWSHAPCCTEQCSLLSGVKLLSTSLGLRQHTGQIWNWMYRQTTIYCFIVLVRFSFTSLFLLAQAEFFLRKVLVNNITESSCWCLCWDHLSQSNVFSINNNNWSHFGSPFDVDADACEEDNAVLSEVSLSGYTARTTYRRNVSVINAHSPSWKHFKTWSGPKAVKCVSPAPNRVAHITPAKSHGERWMWASWCSLSHRAHRLTKEEGGRGWGGSV